MKPRPWQQAIAEQNRAKLLKLIRQQDFAIKKAARDAARRAERLMEGIGSEKIGAVIRKAQYGQKRAELRAILDKLWGEDVLNGVLERRAKAAGFAIDGQKEILAMLMRAAPKDAAELLGSFLGGAERSLDVLLSRFLNAVPLSGNVYFNSALNAGKIDQIVNDALALGKSAREIAEEVAGYINPSATGGVRYSALRLGRTELNNAFHTTSTRAYADQPWVEGVLWNISGSHGQPDDCDDFADADDFGLGAGVFPPDLVPFKPHPQCFCYTTAITPSPGKFIDNVLGGLYG